jgi:hypothetical protein
MPHDRYVWPTRRSYDTLYCKGMDVQSEVSLLLNLTVNCSFHRPGMGLVYMGKTL